MWEKYKKLDEQPVELNGKMLKTLLMPYPNKQLGIILLEGEEIYVAATTSITGVDLPDDEVLIKDYPENVRVLEALIKAKIIKPPKETIATGSTIVHKCKLNI
jgi:hypothetical protein